MTTNATGTADVVIEFDQCFAVREAADRCPAHGNVQIAGDFVGQRLSAGSGEYFQPIHDRLHHLIRLHVAGALPHQALDG